MRRRLHSGALTLYELIAAFTLGPRRVLRLPVASLEPGARADVTVLDPELEFRLDLTQSRSRARNCPFHGWDCKGRAVAVAVNGSWVYSELPAIGAVAGPTVA